MVSNTRFVSIARNLVISREIASSASGFSSNVLRKRVFQVQILYFNHKCLRRKVESLSQLEVFRVRRVCRRKLIVLMLNAMPIHALHCPRESKN